ncbi:type I restriction-modification system subunit M [Chryseobacterium arthrosphaerae]|uniref:type I restriction-modification system subunit M n=1 Tax=Chryseobacterium arthrosphaerae TaxID=651561 RepID=UPI001F4B3CAC|nr:type I restriction-modification system subunit M [Chryseobacterium arthrosphaerae]MDG4655121.1 type I restriction-modification system subunit M [Chryseobacterium arthrosphaerae]
MSEELQEKLRNQLWMVANALRGNMSPSDFMYFSLGFIFYKYLSEKIEMHVNDELSYDGLTFQQAWNGKDESLKEDIKQTCIENLGYFIQPENLYSSIIDLINKKENILPALERSMKRIEDSTIGQESEDDFGGLFSDIDLASPKLGRTADDKNRLVSEVLIALNGIDFGLKEADDIDILGDAYEYMISQFAAGAGKKAGEFYTPQEVSEILAEVVTTDRTRLKDVFDPTCGSGSLLLRTAKNGKADAIYGQEKNPTTFNLCRMNMLLHGVKYKDFDIRNGDTLEADEFGDRQFDAIVANPPFSAIWSAAAKFNNDDRFSPAGVLAPKSKADFAFIQHMLYHLNEQGTMACVAPHGVLFRGSSEGKIRQFLIDKKNYIDAIIGLPANIFYGTSIPTCIIVAKKCRKEDDSILFIDASKDFDKVKNQNKLRKEHIEKIIETYRTRAEIAKYSHNATLQEIEENDYNLNIPRYVDSFEAQEEIDIQTVMQEIKSLEAKRSELDKEIEGYFKELGLIF